LKRKIPFYFHLKDDPIFAFAGLYDNWHNPAGDILQTYTIITTNANDILTPIHNRMPVILKREDEDRWLSGKTLNGDEMQKIFAPYTISAMEVYPVSERVNNPTMDDEGLIQPLKGL
jgi:putative SOS response-associated peptidase YedK